VLARLCSGIPCATVEVDLDGNGSGTWQSTNSSYVPDGVIDCEQTNGVITVARCSATYKDLGFGLKIYYTILPATGSSVCVTSGCFDDFKSGYFEFSDDTTIGAEFRLDKETLTIGEGAPLRGGVTSAPAGIDCGDASLDLVCAAEFNYGDQVTLTASPRLPDVFVRWTGACSGQPAICVLAMTSDKSTDALFAPAPSPTATPKPTPRATPRATARPTPTAVSSLVPGDSGSPNSSESPSATASLSTGSSASPSGSPDPASDPGDGDSLPILLLVLGGGALLGGGAGIGVLAARRRPPASPPAGPLEP